MVRFLPALRLSRLGNNTVGHYKRGVGIGMQITFGTMGGIIASNAFQVQDAPRYLSGRTWIPVQAIVLNSSYPLAFSVLPRCHRAGFHRYGSHPGAPYGARVLAREQTSRRSAAPRRGDGDQGGVHSGRAEEDGGARAHLPVYTVTRRTY